jgi:hypothetical protein
LPLSPWRLLLRLSICPTSPTGWRREWSTCSISLPHSHLLIAQCCSNEIYFAYNTMNQPIQFLVTINTTDPIYYYCGQIGHCQGGMVGVINPPCNGNGINSTGSFNVYKSLAMAVTSVGPLPSVIMGGQLVSSSYPTGRPPGSPGPYYTGFSASCTAGSNSSSNSTESTTTSATTSAATSTTSSGPQPISSSGGRSVYGDISLRHQDLAGFIWQAGSRLELVIAVLFAFIIL